jgi:predicted TIM-barrel fold metal-dependent hydrolase
LEKSLQNFPDLKILGHGPAFWAEIAQVESPGDRSSYPSYPVKEQGAAVRLLREYPNMLGDLSAGSGYNALARDRAHAIDFLNEFQDKLYFGTDLCIPGSSLPLAGFLIELRDEGKLSEEAFEKIARKNAIKLLSLNL